MTPADVAILDHVETPILLVKGGRIDFANRAAIELLGDHCPGQDVRLALRNPAAVELVSSPSGGSITLRGLAGPSSVWSMMCTILDNGDRLIILDDMSMRDSIARAHTDFVANASHELRTPLAAILGYVETLADDHAADDPETRARFLAIIAREAERMQALLDDLMSLSRIEARRHDQPSDPVDLLDLVRAAATETGDDAHVRLSLPQQPVTIAGDRAQLMQVLRNLIDNARKYGKADGSIRVVVEASDTGWASVEVQDEGEGIAPEHLPRLTERFYRVDAGRSRAAGGTGLGLSIVKHVIARHKGRFDISSRLGEGTTASIMLPLIC